MIQKVKKRSGDMKNKIRNREPYNKFKQLLLESDVNQKELAESLGRSRAYVNGILNGRGAGFSTWEVKIIKILFKIEINEYF